MLIKFSLDLSSKSNRIPTGLENSLWSWLGKILLKNLCFYPQQAEHWSTTFTFSIKFWESRKIQVLKLFFEKERTIKILFTWRKGRNYPYWCCTKFHQCNLWCMSVCPPAWPAQLSGACIGRDQSMEYGTAIRNKVK